MLLNISFSVVFLFRRDYTANGGWETFLSYEDPDQDILVGLLRLRKCSTETFRKELVGEPTSIVRELHVYGSVVHAWDKSAGKSVKIGQNRSKICQNRSKCVKNGQNSVKTLKIGQESAKNAYFGPTNKLSWVMTTHFLKTLYIDCFPTRFPHPLSHSTLPNSSTRVSARCWWKKRSGFLGMNMEAQNSLWSAA